MVFAAFVLGRALLVLTVIDAVSDVWRRRGRQRLDIACFMVVLLLSGDGSTAKLPGYVLHLSLLTLLPLLVFRLIGHFRPVSPSVMAAGISLPVVFGLGQALIGPAMSETLRAASQIGRAHV